MILYVILLSLSFVHLVLGQCLSSQYTVLPIENVTVDDPNVRRGVALSVGTPPQNLAFGLVQYANDTWLFQDVGSCTSGEPVDAACTIGHGGIFFPNESSTYENVTRNLTNVPANIKFGSDAIHLNSSLSLPNFPLGFTTAGFTLNSIGLGPSSTILESLYSAGTIASKTWSVFFGLDGQDEASQMAGNVVFGGYDRAKFVGDNVTYPMGGTTNCRTGMVATVNSVDMGFPNGTAQNIMASPILMCLDPSYEVMAFPNAVVQKFAEKAGGDFLTISWGREVGGLVYDVDGVYGGNLSLTFSNGLKVTIPNRQLVMPDYTVGATETRFNDSTREVLISTYQGDDSSAATLLGQPFFTSAYVMVNPDSFTIWQSNATTDTDFIAVDENGNECTSEASTANAGISTTTSSNSTSTIPSNSTATSASTASKSVSKPIIGSTLAIVIIVLGITFACATKCFCSHRRRRKHKREKQELVNSMTAALTKNAADQPYSIPSLASTEHIDPYEYELKLRERAAIHEAEAITARRPEIDGTESVRRVEADGSEIHCVSSDYCSKRRDEEEGGSDWKSMCSSSTAVVTVCYELSGHTPKMS